MQVTMTYVQACRYNVCAYSMCATEYVTVGAG
jgi:hypothetical protein